MRTVIFRPTNDCNLACKYCYDIQNHDYDVQNIRGNATKKFVQNQEMLKNGIHFLQEEEKDKIVIFHGGEPLVVDPQVLSQFCDGLDDDVKFHIQTNGTLIDKKAIDLFKKHHFRVGISLDGCNEGQNAYRVFKNGRSSFSTVLDKIKMLQDQDIRFGIIMSLTKKHIGSEQELYDFLGDHHINANIRRVFASNDFISTMSDQEFVDFFNHLYDIWYDDKEGKVETRQIAELSSELENVLKGEQSIFCSSSDDCFRRYISLDVDGKLYACNRLYGVDEFYYGQVGQISKEELLEKVDSLLRRRNQCIQEECSGCDRLEHCHGGCPAESYDMHHDYTKRNCDYKVKTLVRNHIKERLSND